MEYKEFNILLDRSELNKKNFSTLTELPYQTVMNWQRNNNVPNWVKSWLENYISKKKFDNIKDIIKDEL